MFSFIVPRKRIVENNLDGRTKERQWNKRFCFLTEVCTGDRLDARSVRARLLPWVNKKSWGNGVELIPIGSVRFSPGH